MIALVEQGRGQGKDRNHRIKFALLVNLLTFSLG